MRNDKLIEMGRREIKETDKALERARKVVQETITIGAEASPYLLQDLPPLMLLHPPPSPALLFSPPLGCIH